MTHQHDCIFCKIINQQIPTNLIFEDEYILAFYDINPKAQIHFLVIPKQHLISLLEATSQDNELLGHMLTTGNKLASKLGLKDGYKVTINCGEKGGQEVFHLHMHFFGDID
jgi:histidine triad (HIT) family protein